MNAMGAGVALVLAALVSLVSPASLVLLGAAGATGAAVAAAERFGPWRGVCEPACRLVSPVEFGLVVEIVPVDDGGLGIVLHPLDPEPDSALIFAFASHPADLVVPAAAWRQATRARVAITDPHLRAAWLEILPTGGALTVSWLSATGEPRRAEPPVAEARPALAWLEAATGHRVRIVDPEAPRRSWARDPAAFLATVRACRREGEREVTAVRRAFAWTESEDAVLVVDDRGEERLCVARRDGSAVTAWRPVAADDPLPPHDPAAPHLTLPPAGDCYDQEILRDETGAIVGILSHGNC